MPVSGGALDVSGAYEQRTGRSDCLLSLLWSSLRPALSFWRQAKAEKSTWHGEIMAESGVRKPFVAHARAPIATCNSLTEPSTLHCHSFCLVEMHLERQFSMENLTSWEQSCLFSERQRPTPVINYLAAESIRRLSFKAPCSRTDFQRISPRGHSVAFLSC